MNRGLLVLLVAVGGLSVYLSSSSDDELLAPSREGGGHAPARPDRAPARQARVESRTPAMPDWQAHRLVQGVSLWQARSLAGRDATSTVHVAGHDAQAWAGVKPPAPPPPPVAVVETPAPPMAPPFPHAWVGRFNDDRALRAVLTGAQSTWVVKAGDVIEGQWRVDEIQDRTMSLTYLPLKQQQTLVMR